MNPLSNYGTPYIKVMKPRQELNTASNGIIDAIATTMHIVDTRHGLLSLSLSLLSLSPLSLSSPSLSLTPV